MNKQAHRSTNLPLLDRRHMTADRRKNGQATRSGGLRSSDLFITVGEQLRFDLITARLTLGMLKEEARILVVKDTPQRCVLVLIADGFEETETVMWLSALRQASLCVKSVGLTSGLVSGAYGIWLRPDLAFADLEPWLASTWISLVILPGGGRSLARLEADPRVHKLLCRVIEQHGQIVTGPEGLPTFRVAAAGGNEPEQSVLLRDPDKSPEVFAQSLIRRLK